MLKQTISSPTRSISCIALQILTHVIKFDTTYISLFSFLNDVTSVLFQHASVTESFLWIKGFHDSDSVINIIFSSFVKVIFVEKREELLEGEYMQFRQLLTILNNT